MSVQSSKLNKSNASSNSTDDTFLFPEDCKSG